jgi:hypothetical protein
MVVIEAVDLNTTRALEFRSVSIWCNAVGLKALYMQLLNKEIPRACRQRKKSPRVAYKVFPHRSKPATDLW